jgi:hypothetical protein
MLQECSVKWWITVVKTFQFYRSLQLFVKIPWINSYDFRILQIYDNFAI